MEDDILPLLVDKHPDVLPSIGDPKASEEIILKAWQQIHPAPIMDEVDPNSDKRFYQNFYTTIIGHANTPSRIREAIWNDPEIFNYVFLGLVNLTPEILNKSSDVNSEVWRNRSALLANPRLTTEFIDRLFEQEIAYNDGELDKDFHVWTAFARHLNTSEEVLIKLAGFNSSYMLDTLSNNPKSSTRVINAVWENHILNRVGTPYLEGALASHRNAPEEVLNALVSSWKDTRERSVVIEILRNASTSKRIIKRIMENVNEEEYTLTGYILNRNELDGKDLYDFIEGFSHSKKAYSYMVSTCLGYEKAIEKVVDYFISTNLNGEVVPKEWVLKAMGWSAI